jgi:Xaa-Pro dipeptidase
MKRVSVFSKVNLALSSSDFNALLVCGADHVQYLSGAALPFLYSHTDEPVWLYWESNRQVCICPAKLSDTLRSFGWNGDLRTYSASADNIASALSLVKEIAGDSYRLGVDLERLSVSTFRGLKSVLPNVKISAADDFLRKLRMVKTSEEIEILEDVTARTDHGVAGAMHHVSVLGSKTEKFQAEDLRVHCLERDLWIEGYHNTSLVASGPHARKFWPVAPRFGVGQEKTFKPGEVVRMEMRATQDGYWSNVARTLTMGPVSPEQKNTYEHLTALRQTAIEAIHPSVTCNAVFAAVKTAAEERGADWISELGAGHGIGVTPFEAPYLTEVDSTLLEAGMVLVIDLVVRMPQGEMLRGQDTVIVTPEGCRLTPWYNDWRLPYIAALTF